MTEMGTVRRDDRRKNEFSALIIAKVAAEICESDSGLRGDDGLLFEIEFTIHEWREMCARDRQQVRGLQNWMDVSR
jgi:hypothetical protein